MKIGVLTSSRADYGIYLPLLKALCDDKYFDLKIIAFGTHLSYFHGYTIDQIINDGFNVDYRIETVLAADTPNAITSSMGLTMIKFSEFWNLHQHDFDLVFCLGDRYEMFSAVIAGVPFQIKFAHLHGGEETKGAIDNVFRHSITQASKYHFTSCETHTQRVISLINTTDCVYNVGALSLDNLSMHTLLTKEEFLRAFNIDFKSPTILVTLHPETVEVEKNTIYADEVAKVLEKLIKYQVLITLPNSDTNSHVIRECFLNLAQKSKSRIIYKENLGSKAYFSAMKHCSFMLGNTSSGIIEAASLGKWVINLGKRQEGRQHSENVFNIPFEKKAILKIVEEIEQKTNFCGNNIYYKDNVSISICSILKNKK